MHTLHADNWVRTDSGGVRQRYLRQRLILLYAEVTDWHRRNSCGTEQSDSRLQGASAHRRVEPDEA